MRIAPFLIAMMALAACRPEQTGTPIAQTELTRIPLASVRLDPLATELASGECRPMTLDEFRAAGWRAAVLLIKRDGRDQRRVLVAIDSAGSLRRYSDVRFARDGWAVEAHLDEGVGSVSLWGTRQISRGTAQEVLNSVASGPPRTLAAQVIRQCSAELQS